MVFPRRTRIILGIVAVVALAAGLAWSFRAQPEAGYPNLPQVMPDGSILTFVRADYGKTNTLIDGTRLQKLFHRLIPKGGTNIFGFKIRQPLIHTATPSGENELVLWVRRTVLPLATNAAPSTASSSAPTLPASMLWSQNTYFVAFDEKGNEYENRSFYSFSGNSTNHFIPIRIQAFPRSGKTVGIRIYQNLTFTPGNWKPVAEFKIPNPDPGPHPRWTAPLLPDSHKVDNLEFALTDLKIIKPRAIPIPFFLGTYATVPKFQITQDGVPSANWAPVGAWMFEANGNFRGPGQFIRDPVTHVSSIRDSLNPAEPWKLRVEFCRTNGFKAQEIWTINKLPFVPSAPGSFAASTNLCGTPVNVRISSGHFLRVDLPAKPPGLRVVVVSAVDSETKKAVAGSSSGGSPYSQTTVINSSDNPLALDLTLAVTKSVWVDFMAQPRVEK